ncbi:MAG: polyprenyl synthetase family protein [Proteobacteria bacterium]|nr:polyprenyl synthetase family protein [Pseudomonadota bacterium]
MHLEQFYEQMLPAIEKELESRVQLNDDERLADLHSMLRYHLGWEGPGAGPEATGKRIRPMLTLLTNAAAGGVWERGLPVAAAVELVHNFSLIHDDIQDNSELRRGRQTVWKIWGVAQAINAGDSLFSLAHLSLEHMTDLVTSEQKLKAGNVLRNASLTLTQGQFLDLDYEARGDLTVDSYWPMIQGKTASLIAACAELGAILAGSHDDIQAKYHDFGRYVGLAFQVHDDYLGIWGDAARTGKSAESDLLSGKKTLPILYGIDQQGEFAEKWDKGHVIAEMVPALVRSLEKDGAKEYTIEQVNQLSNQALEALGETGAAGEAQEALVELTEMLAKREH